MGKLTGTEMIPSAPQTLQQYYLSCRVRRAPSPLIKHTPSHHTPRRGTIWPHPHPALEILTWLDTMEVANTGWCGDLCNLKLSG